MPDYYDNIFLTPEEMENLEEWELLRRVAGKREADRRSRRDVLSLLNTVQVNGTSIADLIGWSNNREEEADLSTAISMSADIVRETLDRNNAEGFITLFPDPRAVLIDTEGLDEATRTYYDNKNMRALETVSLYTDNAAEYGNNAANENTHDITITPDDMENMGPWDFLCKATGINANGNSPADVERLLTSIYIDGVRLSDTLQLGDEASFETIEIFSDILRNALDPNSDDYGNVTIRDNNGVRC